MMTREAITMTTADVEKLRELMREAARTEYRNSTYLRLLEAELDRAILVDAGTHPCRGDYHEFHRHFTGYRKRR